MSGLREEYSINDLYVVKFNDNYKEYINKDNNAELTFKTNLYYIVERFLYENEKTNTFSESYKECVGGDEIYYRVSNKKIDDMPPIFSEMYEFPVEYLNEEEKNKMISSNRLYYISLDMNISLLSKAENKEETSFVKKLKK